MEKTESILTSVKKLLGITEKYTQFDLDLIIHINSAFMELTQLGVRPTTGFHISDSSATWSDYLGESPNLEAVKSYVYLRVRLLFDPPSSSAVMENMKQMLNEYAWRLNVEAEMSNEGENQYE